MEIESDYLEAANNCYAFAKENYSEDVNFKFYNDLIIRSMLMSKDSKRRVTVRSSSLRRYLFYMMNGK